MENQGKYCIKWNDFQKNISLAFTNCQESEDFSDVTLVSNDGVKFSAHMLILSASSNLLRTILTQHKSPHPLLFLRGISTDHLRSILDFVYRGEVNVFTEGVEEFLKIAKELEIKGMDGYDEDNKKHDIIEAKKEIPGPKHLEPIHNTRKAHMPDQDSSNEDRVNFYTQQKEDQKMPKQEQLAAGPVVETKAVTVDQAVTVAQALIYGDTWVRGEDTLEKTIGIMMERAGGSWNCKVCQQNFMDSRQKLRDHVEETHVRGVSHICHQCKKVFESRHYIKSHIMRAHKTPEILKL